MRLLGKGCRRFVFFVINFLNVFLKGCFYRVLFLFNLFFDIFVSIRSSVRSSCSSGKFFELSRIWVSIWVSGGVWWRSIVSFWRSCRSIWIRRFWTILGFWFFFCSRESSRSCGVCRIRWWFRSCWSVACFGFFCSRFWRSTVRIWRFGSSSLRRRSGIGVRRAFRAWGRDWRTTFRRFRRTSRWSWDIGSVLFFCEFVRVFNYFFFVYLEGAMLFVGMGVVEFTMFNVG